MSTVRRTHIRCDGYRELLDAPPSPEREVAMVACRYWLPEADRHGSRNAANEREVAATYGWTREAGKDFCAPCTKRKAEA